MSRPAEHALHARNRHRARRLAACLGAPGARPSVELGVCYWRRGAAHASAIKGLGFPKRIAALESGAEEPSSPEELETLRASVAEAKAEIAKEARERKFNADEMCYVASERSLVGSACQPDAGPERLDYESYGKKYGAELDAASGMTFEEDYSDMAEFFKNRTHLLTEHAPWATCC